MLGKLRAKELCPLHRRRDCCGRAEFNRYSQPKKKGQWHPIRAGLWRSDDGREKCSPAELRRRKGDLIRKYPVCRACGLTFTDYDEIELAHIESKGMGGFKRDDSMGNLTLLHKAANRDQGSMELNVYLDTKWTPKICWEGKAK